MTDLKRKLVSAVAAASLILTMSVPVFATSIVITGNGVESKNTADVDVDNTLYVQQENNATISNNINASATTGDNEANRNTGGDVTVDTGNAGTSVSVLNEANSNVASIEDCCEADATVLISGNGDKSDNKVELEVNQGKDSGTFVDQENNAYVKNEIDAKAATGKNEGNRNTGGSVAITTGSALTGVTVENNLNSNFASIGAGGGGNGTTVSAMILDNGVDTKNKIDLDYDRTLIVDQDNNAHIWNGIWADAFTGLNEANRNTGGDASIDTGDAGVAVDVLNSANFNWADVGCDCLLDIEAKIAGNGDSSDNKIEADVLSELVVEQENCEEEKYSPAFWFLRKEKKDHKCGFFNDVWADAKTGKNETNSNTGDPGADPSVDTGVAFTEVDVENTGNVNVYGSAPDAAPEWDLPDWFKDLDVNVGFNWAFLWAWMQGGGTLTS